MTSLRGTIEGLDTSQPLGLCLPSLYQEDDLLHRLVAAFDEVLAPALLVLDNFAAYLDPSLAPIDFVGWLAQWVGLTVDETWSDDHLRELVAKTVAVFKWGGTVHGLRELLEIYTGTTAEIDDPGGSVSSAVPGGDAPGAATGTVVVRIPDGDRSRDLTRLAALVRAATPAH